jgi:hypothetical protein
MYLFFFSLKDKQQWLKSKVNLKKEAPKIYFRTTQKRSQPLARP